MVSSLIDKDTKRWKISMLRNLFLPFEVEIILRIPLSYNLPEDSIIWTRNRRGEFTVKSAYHVALKMIDASNEGESSAGDV